MNRYGYVCLSVIVLVAGAFISTPVALGDQVQPPARIASIYGGRNHQSTVADVEQRERVAGIQPNAARQSADGAAVRQLFEELMQKARGG